MVDAIQGLGRSAIAIRADVADPAAITALHDRVTRALGPIDILVNNAGIGVPSTLPELTLALWDETLATNLRSAFLLTQAVVPGMIERGHGRLVFLSSTAAQTGGSIGPHYAASKAGMLGLMHSYASLLARHGITSNAICPALVETEMVTDNPRAPRPSAVPVGRYGRPDEVGDLAVLLAGNAYITGQTIQVNGGVYPT